MGYTPEQRQHRKMMQRRRDAIAAGEIPPPLDPSTFPGRTQPRALEYKIRAILPKGTTMAQFFSGMSTKTFPSAIYAIAEARRHARVAIADLPVWWAELVVRDDNDA